MRRKSRKSTDQVSINVAANRGQAMELSELIQVVSSYSNPSETESVLTTAFQIASDAHHGFQRISGEPFVEHALAVAMILAEWHAPPPVVAVGLLHDILKSDYSRRFTIDDIHSKFGPRIYRLLDAVINLNSFIRHVEAGDFHSEADVKDFRYHMASFLKKERDAVVIKIADRIHNLQTALALTRYVQELMADAGLTLFTPLVDRLGMGVAKRKLEDFCFKISNPTYYEMLQEHGTNPNLHRTGRQILAELQQVAHEIGLDCEIRWQPSSLYTIGQDVKLGKSIHANDSPLRLSDVGSFIILTNQESDCYRILGVIHKLYPPVEGQFRDFIGNPKENAYRSIHTQVKHSSGNSLQVIIRTPIMDLIAEYGITACWWNAPKEYLPQLPEEIQPIDGQTQVFTPKGEIKYLPRGATVLDFAYHIHTDVGHHCAGALVNGIRAELYRSLQTGDRIEIIPGGPDTEPTLAWLDFVQTPQAINRIRQWLAHNRRNDMVERGRRLLDTELQHLGLDSTNAQVYQLLTKVASKEKLDSMEDLLVSVGVGRHNAPKLVKRMKSMHLKSVGSPNYVELNRDVNVVSPNEAHLPKIYARCCGPVPPDDIVGYRRNDGILAIHKCTCSQIKDSYSHEPEKLIQVKWSSTKQDANYVIIVETLNHPKLASEVSILVTLLGLDMQSFSVHKRADGVTAEVHIYLGKTTSTQRNRFRQALEDANYVNSVQIMHASFLSVSTSQPILSKSLYESNPYGPTLAEGSRFYGRETECERISNLLRDRSRNTAILLCGQKRIGKTSLVLRLQEYAQRHFYPVYIDVQGLKDSSTTQFLHQLMHSIAKILQNKLQEVTQTLSVPHFNKFRKDPLFYYDAFMIRVEELAQSYSLVVILDEFQCLCSLREDVISRNAVFSRLRSRSLHGQGIHLVLSGSGLPNQLSNQCNLDSLLSITYDERLSCLETEAAYRLIKDGLTKVGNISEFAVDFLLDLTAGHPFYLQLLCSRLYEQAHENRTSLTQHFVSQSIEEWIAQTSKNRFQHLWEGYDTTSALRNKLILSAIAQLETDSYGVEYDRLAKAICPTIVEQILVQSLDDLTEMGILKRHQLNYAIEVKLFVRWLQHHYPLELALQEARWL